MARVSTYPAPDAIEGTDKVFVIDDPGGTPKTRTEAINALPIAAGQVTGLGTAATLDVGTGASQIVQLDGSGKIPAVDGSQLTGLSAGLTYFTEAESQAAPNATVYVDSLTAAGASTSVDAALVPKGNGAVIAGIPDGTTTGGDKRGVKAVDWQTKRYATEQVASGIYSVVCGGSGNKATATSSAVVGGTVNQVTGTLTFVGGGNANIASDSYAVVVGGQANQASGQYSIIPGGHSGKADKWAQLALSAGKFAAVGDAQISTLVVRRSTTDATPSELFLTGAAGRCTIATDTTWAFTITVVARRTDADNESAAYKFEGCIDNNAGTTALVGSVTKTVLAEDTVAWDANVTADNTNDALVVTVTGEAGKTIYWVAKIELVEVTG